MEILNSTVSVRPHGLLPGFSRWRLGEGRKGDAGNIVTSFPLTGFLSNGTGFVDKNVCAQLILHPLY